MTRGVKVAIWGASALLTAGLATGVAEAAAGSSGPATGAGHAATSGSTAKLNGAQPRARELRMLARHAAHAEVVVKTRNGWQTIDVQRGVVTAASAASVTLRSADGFTATYVVNASSRVRLDRARATASQAATGDRALVIAVKSGHTETVKLLVVRDRKGAPGHGSLSSSRSAAADA